MLPILSSIRRSRDDCMIKFSISLRRSSTPVASMSKCESMQLLNAGGSHSKRKIKIRFRMLARKCYSDKWSDECAFDQKTGEDMFK